MSEIPTAVDGLSLAVTGDVAILTLNRPEKRNAINQAMWRGLPKTVAAAERSPAKVLVVRGAGETFAAGADISEFETLYATRDSAQTYFAQIGAGMEALAAFAKPVIAMIDGACVGGGLGLALCCDIRIASDRARLGITPSKLGLMYSLGDTRRLVEMVGPSKAKDILFTGRLLGADEALSIGLIDEVCPADQLMESIQFKTASIASASQYSARQSKRIIRRILDGQLFDDAETTAWMADAVEGPDFQEGRAAFLAKRPPIFPVR